MHSIENSIAGRTDNKKPESLQELIGNAPDAIVIMSGASKFNPKKERYEMGAYSNVDDSGLVTGGKDRDIAGAELHRSFPDSPLVTTSRNMNQDIPSYASIQKDELIRMGVPAEQIIEEDISYRTVDGLKNTLLMAQERGWKKLVYITSPYHVTRMQEFLQHLATFSASEGEKEHLQTIQDNIGHGLFEVKIVSTDEILPFRSKHYEAYFDSVKQLPGYKLRVEAEQRGVDDIRSGKYQYTGKK